MLMMMFSNGKGELSFACDEGIKKWTQLHPLYEALFACQEFKMHCKIMDLWYHSDKFNAVENCENYGQNLYQECNHEVRSFG
jgi:hypothetical protein